MHRNHEVLNTFYSAFAALEPDGMEACYADAVAFQDEVFTLNGRAEVMGMWRMLCDAVRSKGREDWQLAFSGVTTDATNGAAHWDATYRFSATGRMVVNHIDGSFGFDAAGRIVQHRDRFDFWSWSRQALGVPGVLLGWTPFLRNKVRQQASAGLRKYLAGKSRSA